LDDLRQIALNTRSGSLNVSRDLLARQLSPMGGELRCEIRDERVIIGGATVEYLRGEITVEV